jgi:hypothetical protein
MNDRDPIADAVGSLEAPPLDALWASRVGARARHELRMPARPAAGGSRFFLATSRALVPAMLALAAIVQTAGTASIVARIYAKPSIALSP